MRWDRAAAGVVAAVALLPFVRGVLSGGTFYFRDLSSIFLPYRRYAVEGLRRGQVWFWDPYVHEGVPLVYVPIGYPLDLLQALWLDERWFSLLLALHVPFAAVAFLALARRLGLSTVAAAGGALVYALGGFALSTVNLYVYVQALAWAPLVVLGLRSAAFGRPRAVVAAALAIGVALSTLGVELALQAIAIGLVLAFRRNRPACLRGPLAGALLGFALAAPVILVMRANMAAGERAYGFPVDVVLNQSVHPFTLVQVLVANLYGDLGRLPDRWWGSNFFDRGFPYILSLYLGATAVALALTGAATARRRCARLAVLVLVALWVALGRWGGLAPLLEVLPDGLRVFRYPTKAFFAVHFGTALLAATGLHGLSRGRGWRPFVVLVCAFGLALTLAPALPRIVPGGVSWFLAHFFPPALGAATRAADLAEILGDAARGGLLAVAAALVGALVTSRRVAPRLGAVLVAAIVGTDLLRAGAGLNPMTARARLDPEAPTRAMLDALPGRQRVFTCHPEGSRAYWAARRDRPHDHESLTLAAWANTLTPYFNRRVHVPSALGEDLTSLVPRSRLLPTGRGCGDPRGLVPELRAAGVSHVLTLDTTADPDLTLVAEVSPAALAPLSVHVYRVRDPRPLRFLAGAAGSVHSIREEPDRVELDVEADGAGTLVVLDGAFPGWTATVNGRPEVVDTVERHRGVSVPAGRSRVEMTYHPRGLRAGLALTFAAAAVLAVLWRRDGRARGSQLRGRPGRPVTS